MYGAVGLAIAKPTIAGIVNNTTINPVENIPSTLTSNGVDRMRITAEGAMCLQTTDNTLHIYHDGRWIKV